MGALRPRLLYPFLLIIRWFFGGGLHGEGKADGFSAADCLDEEASKVYWGINGNLDPSRPLSKVQNAPALHRMHLSPLQRGTSKNQGGYDCSLQFIPCFMMYCNCCNGSTECN